MDVEGDLIWGDDSESQVFAQAHSLSRCLLFRYSFDSKRPQSLASRIVTCFHDLPVKDASDTFPNRASMRESLYASIREAWNQCMAHPSATTPDVTIEIYEDIERHNQWRISHESLYNKYLQFLSPLSHVFRCAEEQLPVYDTVDYSSLIPIRHLGGRGTTALVRSSQSSETLGVFKGVDFGTFLGSQIAFEHMKDTCYREIRTICSLSPHPHIIPPSSTFVTAKSTDEDNRVLVCGALYPYMQHGTIDDQIEDANATGVRLPLFQKADWCFQMASAIAHTHLTAHTFHMDIKTANIVLDARKDLLLIDWEQGGANLYTLAPEADGSWDVQEAIADSSFPGATESANSKLLYKKYSGPERANLAWSRPKWNVFPIWRDSHPRALEAAEVFSLGRTMWMLLEQVTESDMEDHFEVVTWSDAVPDIPELWKDVVSRCLDPDPNERISLFELVDFWETMKEKDWTSS